MKKGPPALPASKILKLKNVKLIEEQNTLMGVLAVLEYQSTHLRRALQEKSIEVTNLEHGITATVIAFTQENRLLKRVLEDKRDEIAKLEQRIATLEAVTPVTGTPSSTFELFTSIFSCKWCSSS